MLLREDLEHSGKWLFRWRSILPLLMLPLLPAALGQYRHPFESLKADFAWEMFCFAISTAGLTIRIKTIGHTPKGTSGRNMRNQRADSLNTTGMYSLVRNPLYCGNFLMYLGVALVPMVWWLPALLVLLFALYYERIVFAEERFLEEKFGDAYRNWARTTPAFIPLRFMWRRPELPFSLRTVIKREYLGMCGMVAMFMLIELGENLAVHGRIHLDWHWQTLGILGLVSAAVIRILHKQTSLLETENR